MITSVHAPHRGNEAHPHLPRVLTYTAGTKGTKRIQTLEQLRCGSMSCPCIPKVLYPASDLSA